MQSIPQVKGVFNSASENGTDLFSLTSHTTSMGHRSHVVRTSDATFAWALFEQAFEVDLEPYRTHKGKGVYQVEFICSDAERDTALEAAKQGREVFA